MAREKKVALVDPLTNEPDKKEEEKPDRKPLTNTDRAEAAAKKLSEEDEAKKAQIEEIVEAFLESSASPQIKANALTALATEINSSQSAAGSGLPKVLKFLREHYAALVAVADATTPPDAAYAAKLYDICSVLAMTFSGADEDHRDCLRFKVAASNDDVSAWGHEYVRNLAGELGREYGIRRDVEQGNDASMEVDDETEGTKKTEEEEEEEKAGGDAMDTGSDAPKKELTWTERKKAEAEAERAARKAAREIKTPETRDARARFHAQPAADLFPLAKVVVAFFMKNNAEPEAVDLLLEVERLQEVTSFVDDANFQRICLYLISFASYIPEPDNTAVLRTALDIYRAQAQHIDALRLAIRLDDRALVKELFLSDAISSNASLQRQAAYLLGSQHLFLLDVEEEDTLDPEVVAALNQTNLFERFIALAEDLDVLDPKTPDEIYKTQLDDKRATFAGVDSARQNLAKTFVNAFVNAGFGHDTLMTGDSANKWIYKNKDHGMMSAAASLGMVLQGHVDDGLAQVDTLLEFGSEDYVKAGALLAIGVVNCGVRHEVDPAVALLADYVEEGADVTRVGACLGLGLAYCGSAREDIVELLKPSLESETIHVAAFASLALGMVMVGTADADVAEAILEALIERPESALADTRSRYFSLGLGLLFLRRGDEAEMALATLSALPGDAGEYARLTVETCAFCGTGNVLKVQSLLGMIAEANAAAAERELAEKEAEEESKEKDKGAAGARGGAAGSSGKGGKKQAAEASPHSPAALATLGLAIVSMGEDLSRDMSKRMFEHLLAYGDVDTRRAVPLAMALTHLSNPDPSVIDVLGKLSHDSNAAVAQGAALALGLVGAGTNNARIGQMLRALAAYRHREPSHLFAVRVAQGLLHLGKGTMTLSPFQSHKLLPSRVALAGLLVAFHSFLDLDGIIMGPTHFIMYALSAAMRPRFVMTVDEQGNELHVPVRVGDAVDTVGQAGKRKQITGFQTRSTPVLLSPNERCELATDEYLAYTPVLEGIVVLRVNPDAPAKTPEQKKQEKDLAERREEAKRKARERRDRMLAEAAAKEEEEAEKM
jgi:26S proteasome regulatory subunit N1